VCKIGKRSSKIGPALAGLAIILAPLRATAAAPVVTSVVNGASFQSGFSQGSWVTIKGTGLAGTTRTWTSADFNGSALPASLDQVSVTIGGKAAYVYYVSPAQLNVLAPADAALGPVPVQVTYAGAASNTVMATETAFSPALFTFTPQSGKYAAAVRPDGQYVGPADLYTGLTAPARAGDTLMLFGTGFGPTDPAADFSQIVGTPVRTANAVTATIGGLPAAVQYAGLVAPGEYQFNVVVPNVPGGDNLVVLTVNETATQAGVYLNIAGSTAGSTPSATTLKATPATAYAGTTVTLTAAVTPAAATGTITFYQGGKALGTRPLDSGSATLSTSFSAAGSYSFTASYSGDSVYAESGSGSANAMVDSSEPLKFAADGYSTGTMSVKTGTGTYSVAYRLYQNIVYVAAPVNKNYQSMNVFVPVTVNGAPIDAANAPILLEIGVGGYMSSSTWGRTNVSTNGQYALAAGWVVVTPGCRGRDNVTSGGTYYGKAPAAIVDLKSAVRYIRYNSGSFPGNPDRIISTGSSAGGALSSVLGASGNSSLYDPYLAEIGAAYANDNTYAVIAYSPITNLDHSDGAYEWQYGTAALSSTKGQVDQTLSAQLKAIFAVYQNGLALTGKNNYGPITAGNINDYVMQAYLIPSATQYLASLSSSALSTYLSQHTWMAWVNNTASFRFEDYVAYIGRMKGLPAFDSFDLSSPETIEFGDATTNARHFTDYSLRYTTGNSNAAISGDLRTIVNMMNPMHFIGQKNSSIAQYWFIRDGSKATDTSSMVIVDLATSLENLLGESHVNAWEYWDGGHAVNQDPDALMVWLAGVLK
jgi:uncharacterized protein (TIGR03437 family)